ncbi:hypothetical protein QP103_06920, partial [Gardnerella swidsinskii]|nr:hypothetical protein [Gardnerella swidsinskii]
MATRVKKPGNWLIMPDATLAASYQAYARQRNSLMWRDFCRSDKAFTPHPTSISDATLTASYQAYARLRNSL